MEDQAPNVTGKEKVPAHIRTLVIMFDTRTNQVNVSGPILDKVNAYGMLEMAKEAIYEYHLRAQANNGAPVDEANRIITE